jgi:hypothetical protein
MRRYGRGGTDGEGRRGVSLGRVGRGFEIRRGFGIRENENETMI